MAGIRGCEAVPWEGREKRIGREREREGGRERKARREREACFFIEFLIIVIPKKDFDF